MFSCYFNLMPYKLSTITITTVDEKQNQNNKKHTESTPTAELNL